MRVAIGVFVSDGVYETMKKLWVSNVLNANNDHIHVFFLNDVKTKEEEKTITLYPGIYDLYSMTNFVFNESHLQKTKDFFQKVYKYYDFILRTNASTLFDINKLCSFLKKCPIENYLAGPFIAKFYGLSSAISGTCIIMSTDVTELLLKKWDSLSTQVNKDVALTTLMIANFNGIILQNIRRVDFVENKKIIFHKCTSSSKDEIFCYRFKSEDRLDDCLKMQELMYHFDISKMIGPENITIEEDPDFELYFNEVPFKIEGYNITTFQQTS